MGTSEYELIAEQFRVPIVVNGFEPLDLLEGIPAMVRQLEDNRGEVENQYARAVRAGGQTLQSRQLIADVFEVCDRAGGGIGANSRQRFQVAQRVP